MQGKPGGVEPQSSHQSRGRQERPSCSSEDTIDDPQRGKPHPPGKHKALLRSRPKNHCLSDQQEHGWGRHSGPGQSWPGKQCQAVSQGCFSTSPSPLPKVCLLLLRTTHIHRATAPAQSLELQGAGCRQAEQVPDDGNGSQA